MLGRWAPRKSSGQDAEIDELESGARSSLELKDWNDEKGLVAVPYAVLVSKLLIFLDAKDLLVLGCTSRVMKLACDDPRLWSRLLFLDFVGPTMQLSEFSKFADAAAKGELVFGETRNALTVAEAETRLAESDRQVNLRRNNANSSLYSDASLGLNQSIASISSSDPLSFPHSEQENQANSNPDEHTLENGNEASRSDESTESHRNTVNAPQSARLWTRHSSGSDHDRLESGIRQSRSCSSPCWSGDFQPQQPEVLLAKRKYLERIQEYLERAKLAKREKKILREIDALKARRAKIERWIWWACFQISGPLVLACPLVTFVLLAVQLDGGLVYRPWVFLSPMIILYFSLAISIVIGSLLLLNNGKQTSILYGMYGNFRGLVQFCMHKVCKEKRWPMVTFLMCFIALVLFTFLIGGKLQHPNSMLWTSVFVPLWVLFLLILVICWFRAKDSSGGLLPYILSLSLIWFPLFAFFLLLPLYLDSFMSTNLVLVFIPIWFLEALLVLFPLFINLSICCSKSRDDVCDDLKSGLIMFAYIAPIVVFTVLLVYKIEKGVDTELSYAKAFAPLFFWFSFCLVGQLVYQETCSQPTFAELSCVHPLLAEKSDIASAMRDTSSLFRYSSTQRIRTIPREPNSRRLRWNAMEGRYPSRAAAHTLDVLF